MSEKNEELKGKSAQEVIEEEEKNI